jgi:hypothetical protein
MSLAKLIESLASDLSRATLRNAQLSATFTEARARCRR